MQPAADRSSTRRAVAIDEVQGGNTTSLEPPGTSSSLPSSSMRGRDIAGLPGRLRLYTTSEPPGDLEEEGNESLGNESFMTTTLAEGLNLTMMLHVQRRHNFPFSVKDYFCSDYHEFPVGIWYMSDLEDVNMHVGWVAWVVTGLCLILGIEVARSWLQHRPEDGKVAEPGELAELLYGLLWGPGWANAAIDIFVMVLACLNFVVFALATEALLGNDEKYASIRWALHLHDPLEIASFFFLLVVLVCRAIGAQAHSKYGRHGAGAVWHYLVFDGYANIDELSLILTVLTYTLCWVRYTNFIWFTGIRLIDMLARRGKAIHVRGVREAFLKEKSLLLSMFALGFVVWLLVSGLFYVLMHDMDETRWPWAVHVIENPAAAAAASLLQLGDASTSPGLLAGQEEMSAFGEAGNGTWLDLTTAEPGGGNDTNWTETTTLPPPMALPYWQRTGSVPSSMFFALLNLCKKNPLAHQFVGWRRLLIIAVNVFGVPLFALPLTTFGAMIMRVALTEAMKHAEEEEEEEEEESIAWYLEGWFYCLAAGALGFGSTFAFFVQTAGHIRLLFVPLYINGVGLACIDLLVGLVFAAEWTIRLQHGASTYLRSLWCWVDFASFFPGLLHFCLVLLGFDLESAPGACLRALCIVRIFKTERMTGSFSDMYKVLKTHSLVVTTTGIVSVFVWMMASTLLFMSEYTNPDTLMRYHFGSVAKAAWTEGINVFGEWVVADFSVMGKTICTFMALFSVSICVVPLTVLSAGYFMALADDYAETLEMSEEVTDLRRWWQLAYRPTEPGFRRKVYDMCYAHIVPQYAYSGRPFPTLYRLMRALTIFVALLSTVVTVVGSLPEITQELAQKDRYTYWVYNGFWWVDFFTLPVFIANYSLRTYLLGWRHPCSFLGVAELLSLLAVATTLSPLRDTYFHPGSEYSLARYLEEKGQGSWESMLDRLFAGPYVRKSFPRSTDFMEGFIFQLRVLRLFCADSYFGTVNVLKDVIYVHRRPLARSGLTLVSLWYVHATLLYLVERDDIRHDLSLPVLSMQDRYGNALDALQYSLVHLTGDFPVCRYRLLAKMVLLPGISVGLVAFATFTGIFSSGFVNFLMRARETELLEIANRRMAAAANAALKMQRNFRRLREKKQRARERIAEKRRAVLEKHAATQALEEGAEEVRQQPDWHVGELLEREDEARPERQAEAPAGGENWRERLHRQRLALRAMVEERTWWGKVMMRFFHAVLLVNVGCTIVLTVPEVHDVYALVRAIDFVDFVCCTFFIIEYAVRIAAGGHLGHPLTAMRVFDLLCMLPTFAMVYYWHKGWTWQRTHQGMQRLWEMVMLVRVVRILDFNMFRREVVCVFRGLSSACQCLAVPIFLALYVWIFISSLFCWLEFTYDGPSKRYFNSIPEAMYWSSHFLVGEWALIDFSSGAGSRVCILCVLFGAMIFAIPLGIIVESVQSSLMMELVENESIIEVSNAMEEEEEEEPGEGKKEQPPMVGNRVPLGDPAQGLRKRLRRAAMANKAFGKARSKQQSEQD